ncbi:uncharacterized [Tachysurus ichikawai]
MKVVKTETVCSPTGCVTSLAGLTEVSEHGALRLNTVVLLLVSADRSHETFVDDWLSSVQRGDKGGENG